MLLPNKHIKMKPLLLLKLTTARLKRRKIDVCLQGSKDHRRHRQTNSFRFFFWWYFGVLFVRKQVFFFLCQQKAYAVQLLVVIFFSSFPATVRKIRCWKTLLIWETLPKPQSTWNAPRRGMPPLELQTKCPISFQNDS